MPVSHFSRVQVFASLWTVADQAPLSMGFSWQKQWSGLPCPPPGDLSDPGMEPVSLISPAFSGRFFTTSATWEGQVMSDSISISAAEPLHPLSGPFYFTISSVTPQPPAHPGPLRQPLTVRGTHGLCF